MYAQVETISSVEIVHFFSTSSYHAPTLCYREQEHTKKLGKFEIKQL